MGMLTGNFYAGVGVMSDLAVAAAATWAGYVAWSGLQTWRRQLTGTTEYELARKYLRSAYRVRDEISRFRNPFISSDEMIEALHEGNIKASVPSHEATNAAYVRRWNRLAEVFSDLRVEALEAEVLWGKPARDASNALEACGKKLNAALATLFAHQARGGSAVDPETRQVIDPILSQISADPDRDAFTADVVAALARVEEIAKPHLQRKQR